MAIYTASEASAINKGEDVVRFRKPATLFAIENSKTGEFWCHKTSDEGGSARFWSNRWLTSEQALGKHNPVTRVELEFIPEDWRERWGAGRLAQIVDVATQTSSKTNYYA